ncbi:hypothetical protein N7478_010463 [Penicillium angulare]|uniref:uncharacterized protein n=1 Tax=Penicillium angulare TaxID=116970 RepID=UPI00254060A7|nr:uncharacterized protein N7478_010463 [Penicillium angulare]KAJ5267655.1 hypothetical protein N7478_010463 [Penicillium angulare]
MPALRSRSRRFAVQTPDSTAKKRIISLAGSSPLATKDTLCHAPEEITPIIHVLTKSFGVSSPSAANLTPPEILLQIYSMLTPREFDSARRTCSQWMKVSLNPELLESMLKRAGWWDAWRQDCAIPRIIRHPSSYESDVWRMSKRFATECLLSGRKRNIEKPAFVKTGIVGFSGLAKTMKRTRYHAATDSRNRLHNSDGSSTFSVSNCSNYLLVTTGCMIYVFRILDNNAKPTVSSGLEESNLVPITSISCPFEVISATLDTSNPRFVVAALLSNRVGMVCDIEAPNLTQDGVGEYTAGSVDDASDCPSSKPSKDNIYFMPKTTHSSTHYFYNVCSEDHPPRTVALSPGRRCIAFGCAGGIEIHWVDESTQTDQRRHFPMSQPSETLHFLPNSLENTSEMRLISSLAGPGIREYACRQSPYPNHLNKCHFNFCGDSKTINRKPLLKRSLSLTRATHCHHYRAIPINDGYHIASIEPRTGFLCIGSDTPIGGPTSYARAFICVPPFNKDLSLERTAAHTPTAFAVASDLRWGLRVVAAYEDRVVLYSVPLDIFNIVCKERETQGDGVMGSSNLAQDWFVDSEHFRKRRESLIQNQNGDWEFLLSGRSRPAGMISPFKIHGKEVGRVENVVELALQSSNGGARVWAFSASGDASIFDIDTFTSPTQSANDIPCSVVRVSSDGSVDYTSTVHRTELGFIASSLSRKRKAHAFRDDFAGRYGTSQYTFGSKSDALQSVNAPGIQHEDSPMRQPSFAACIVDFKIPDLGIRDDKWKQGRRALKDDS